MDDMLRVRHVLLSLDLTLDLFCVDIDVIHMA
jgi:hypothetical protein